MTKWISRRRLRASVHAERSCSYALCVRRLLVNAVSDESNCLGNYVNDMLNMNVRIKMQAEALIM